MTSGFRKINLGLMLRKLHFCVLLLFLIGFAPSAFAQTTTFYVNSNLDDTNARDSDPGDGTCSDMNGRCTLRAAVDEANASSGDVVIVIPGQLPAGVSGNYSLSRVAPNVAFDTYEDENAYGDLDLNGSFSSLTLQGTGTPGPQISISPNDRILHVGNGNTVNIERLHLTGGTARAGRNGVSDGSGVGVNGENGADGGALLIDEGAMVTIDQVTFSSNTTQSGGNGATPASSIDQTIGGDAGSGGNGGAVCIRSGAQVTVTRTTFYQNGTGDAGSAGAGQATGPADGGAGGDGGNGGAIYNAGQLTLSGSTIYQNTCGGPGSGGGGVNGGENGAVGEGGSGGGIANARRIDGDLQNEGTVIFKSNIVAGNVPGDDTSNGKQPGVDVFQVPGSQTINSDGHTLFGNNETFEDFQGTSEDQFGTADSPIDPVITGLNLNDDEAVPTLTLGSGSPAIDAGTTIQSFDYDAKGFRRPADGLADIGATETNSEPVPQNLMIVEIDVNSSDGSNEFVELENNGDYAVQLDNFVIVAFGSGPSSCFTANLYGELQPGETYVFSDGSVDNSDLDFLFDNPLNGCGEGDGDFFNNESGVIALYQGTANSFGGVGPDNNPDAQLQTVVYDNGMENRSSIDWCTEFGLNADCGLVDGGDGQSIQLLANGTWITSNPTPGTENAAAVLPVELVSLTARSPKSGLVELEWNTAFEENNDGFSVELRRNERWESIGWVNGSGNSATGASYAFVADGISAGEHFFRLRQRDFDGTEAISDVVSATVREATRLDIYPNPATTELSVVVPNERERVEIFIRDGYGRVVARRYVAGGTNVTLPVSELPVGYYYLTVVSGSTTTTQPFTKR